MHIQNLHGGTDECDALLNWEANPDERNKAYYHVCTCSEPWSAGLAGAVVSSGGDI